MSCFARFAFQDSVVQLPIFFMVCHAKTGNAMARAIFNRLVEENADFGKLVSVTTDGAQSMSGKQRGMAVCLKRLVERHCASSKKLVHDISTMWCFAHRINLPTRDFLGLKGVALVKSFADWLTNRR